MTAMAAAAALQLPVAQAVPVDLELTAPRAHRPWAVPAPERCGDRRRAGGGFFGGGGGEGANAAAGQAAAVAADRPSRPRAPRA
jgi:hypothetical protein